MIIQIYEAINISEAENMVKLGIDYIGVVAGLKGNYPGVLHPKQAYEIFKGVAGQAKKVLLPFSESLEDISILVSQIKPDILHLAVAPEILLPTDVQTLKIQFPEIKIMRTIPVESEDSIRIAKQYDGIADYLLLDSRSKKDNHIGITGETHDWNISKKIVESVSIPVILAGGLGPDNVADAILKVRPFGVDSKTKTDKIGGVGKDMKKIENFVKNVKITESIL